MRTKTRFIPDPKFNKGTLLPSSNLAVYRSSVEGAVSISMSREGAIQAGTRLTAYQAKILGQELLRLAKEIA